MKLYKCISPHCNKVHRTLEEARECHAPLIMYECTKCETTYYNRDNAIECCDSEVIDVCETCMNYPCKCVESDMKYCRAIITSSEITIQLGVKTLYTASYRGIDRTWYSLLENTERAMKELGINECHKYLKHSDGRFQSTFTHYYEAGGISHFAMSDYYPNYQECKEAHHARLQEIANGII